MELKTHNIVIFITVLLLLHQNNAQQNVTLDVTPFTSPRTPITTFSTKSPYIAEIERGDAIVNEFIERFHTTHLVDLVFVVDKSGTVTSKGWGSITRFIRDILEHFTVNENNTRVAIITYNMDVDVNINDLETHYLNKDENKCTLNERIDTMLENIAPYGYTSTYSALDKAYEILQDSRLNSKKAVIVITDGRSNRGPPPVKAAFNILSLKWDPNWNETAYGPQVEIYAFGIDNVDMSELDSIASSLPNHTFLISNFDAFEGFARSLHGGKQNETWISPRNTSACGSCRGYNERCLCGAKSGEYACVCAPGYERIDAKCMACSHGYYKDSYSLDACCACPENMTTSSRQSTSIHDCKLKPGMRSCPALEPVEHGSVFFVPGKSFDEVLPTGEPCSEVKDGNSCHHVCDEGYWMDGIPVMICNKDGQWSGETPICRLVDCGPIQNQITYANSLDNANLDFLSDNTTYGAIINATCLWNTVPLGDTTWYCDEYGRWTIPWNFQCKRVFCSPLQLNPDMTASPNHCRTSKQEYNNECQLGCKPGFDLIGSDTVSCDFDKQPKWTPKPEEIYCKDVTKPEITCPVDMELRLDHWNDTHVKVNLNPNNAQVLDNSDNYTITLSDVPKNGMFPVGSQFVKYTVTDGGGNTDSCTHYIRVRKIGARLLRNCPSTITRTMSSRRMAVTWEDPLFVDHDDTTLIHECNKTRGSEFQVGTHVVRCYAKDYPYVDCTFQIVLKEPECAVPFTERPPENGALICGRDPDGDVVRQCRIHCKARHELRGLRADKTWSCGWDGQWNIDSNAWPRCQRSLRNPEAYIDVSSNVYFRYGPEKCEEMKEEIKQHFKQSMHTIIANKKICTDEIDCSVTDIEIWCHPSGRRKRDLNTPNKSSLIRQKREASFDVANTTTFNMLTDNDPLIVDHDNITIDNVTMSIGNDTLTDDNSENEEQFELKIDFRIKSHMKNKSTADVTEQDQIELRSKVETIFFDVFEMGVEWEGLNGENLTLEMVGFPEPPEFPINCSSGQEKVRTSEGYTCYTCAAGTYAVNNTCEPCAIGFYQDEEGQESCIECPENSTTLYNGASHHCQCVSSNVSRDDFKHNELAAHIEGKQCYMCGFSSANDSCDDSMYGYCGPKCIHGICEIDSFSTFTCDCLPGYTGERCDTRIQPCCHENDACDIFICAIEDENNGPFEDQCGGICKHGDCNVTENGCFVCDCFAGYTGSTCDTFLEPCWIVDCLQNGTCELTTGGIVYEGQDEEQDYPTEHCSAVCVHGECVINEGECYTCDCDPGYTGNTCDEIDQCYDVTCQNNGTCEEITAGFVCNCTEYYEGKYCEIEKSLCEENLCIHGYCVELEESYTCVCDEQWQGKLCDTYNPCYSNPCNHGNCSITTSGYECECYEGYAGESCQFNLDVCVLEPCQHNGTCTTELGRVVCECPPAYTGEFCEEYVNPCDNYTCYNNATCETIDYTPICRCLEGYMGLRCEKDADASFDLVFPRGDADDFVLLRPITQSLRNLTTCLWLRTNDAHHYGTILSYAVPSDFMCVRGTDAFTLFDYGMLKIIVNREMANTRFMLNNGYWQHVCVRWQSDQGAWSLYVNGTMRASGMGLANNTNIEQYGYLVLGQRQTTPGNAYRSSSSFKGEMHQLNIYSDYLTREEIGDIYTAVELEALGDVMQWSDVIGHLNGHVMKRNESWLLDVNECLQSECEDDYDCPNSICPNGTRCVDELGSYHCDVISCHIQCQNGGQCVNGTGNGEDDRCICPPKYTGLHCETEVTCDLLQCLHNATCNVINGIPQCQCVSGYTGQRCELTSTDPCDTVSCLNLGTCNSHNDQFWCDCMPKWKGRYCQTSYTPSCDHTACLNNGTCVLDDNEQFGYRCQCSQNNMGPNCEILPCKSNPCQNDGKCVPTMQNKSYQCRCKSGFHGDHCEIVVTTKAPSTIPVSSTIPPPKPTTPRVSYCNGVECKNGGTCSDNLELKTFECNCLSGYKGQYCEKRRKSSTRIYAVTFTLKMNYSANLAHNETLKRKITLSVHNVYRKVMEDSKLYVDIKGFRKGSVLVDCELAHTVFDDRFAPGTEYMENMFKAELMGGKLGTLDASMDNFKFQLISAKSGGMQWWLVIVILLAVLLIAFICLGVYWYRKRRLRSKPCKLNNFPDAVKNRIRNPLSRESGAMRMQPFVHEDIYAEPVEMPYAVTSFSEFENVKNENKEDTMGRRYPSKRGKDINKDWASVRSGMPLPPRPDENPILLSKSRELAQQSAASLDSNNSTDPRYKHPKPQALTPPPAYKDAMAKNIKMNNANINPNSGGTTSVPNLYGPSEGTYFTPLSDDDKLKGDQSKTKATSSDVGGAANVSISADNVATMGDNGESTYLTPRTTRIESDHLSDDEYMAPSPKEGAASSEPELPFHQYQNTANDTTKKVILSSPNINNAGDDDRNKVAVKIDLKSKKDDDTGKTKLNKSFELAPGEYLPMNATASRPVSAEVPSEYLHAVKNNPSENEKHGEQVKSPRSLTDEYLTPLNIVKTPDSNYTEDTEYLRPVDTTKHNTYANQK